MNLLCGVALPKGDLTQRSLLTDRTVHGRCGPTDSKEWGCTHITLWLALLVRIIAIWLRMHACLHLRLSTMQKEDISQMHDHISTYHFNVKEKQRRGVEDHIAQMGLPWRVERRRNEGGSYCCTTGG
jgi:hypothetical protein